MAVDARLIFSRGIAKEIGSVIIDAMIQETHTQQSTSTNYPIENGSTITDHIINQPLRLSIRGLIGPATLTDSTGGGNRVLDGFNELQQLQKNKELITVITGLKVYENMAILNFTVPRNKDNGAALNFNMELEEKVIVNSQSVKIPSVTLAGSDSTKQQTESEADIGKANSGQTQQNKQSQEVEQDDFIKQLEQDAAAIDAAFGGL